MSTAPSRPSRTLRRSGIAVLAIGCLAAAAVYYTSGSDDASDTVAYSINGGQTFPIARSESKRETMQLERINGKTGVWMLEFDDWLASLAHGRRLAWTLALSGAVIAGACFYLAGLADEDDEPPPSPRRSASE